MSVARLGFAWYAISDKSDLAIRIWSPIMISTLAGLVVIPSLYLALTIIKALSVPSNSTSPEHCIELLPKHAKRLFEEIDTMIPSKKQGTISRVYLVESLNAEILHVSKSKRWNDRRYNLFIGLPLMMALSPEEFKAVLAHEIAHIFVGSPWVWRWVTLSKTRFVRVVETLQQKDDYWHFGVLNRFFYWYLPVIESYLSAFSRFEEHAADQFFAHVINPSRWTSALARIDVSTTFLEEVFWPNIYQLAYSQAEPPQAVFNEMKARLRNDINTQQTKKWLTRSLLKKTFYHDSHPPLSQRLSAVGTSEIALEPIDEIAATYYLQESGEAYYIRQFSGRWGKAITSRWRQEYTYAQGERRMLYELEKKTDTTSLQTEEAFRYACLVERFTGKNEALPLYQNVLSNEPSHAMAIYAVGRILTGRDDEHGIEYLEKAIELDSNFTLDGCELLYYFLIEQGKQKEAEQYYQRAREYIDLLQKAQQERVVVGNKHYTYLEHGLSQQHLEPIIEHISGYPKITQGYLVRLHVRYFPEKPFWVLGIVIQLPWYNYYVTYKKGLEFAQQLKKQLELPGDFLVLPLEKIQGVFLKQWETMKTIRHSVIYRKMV